MIFYSTKKYSCGYLMSVYVSVEELLKLLLLQPTSTSAFSIGVSARILIVSSYFHLSNVYDVIFASSVHKCITKLHIQNSPTSGPIPDEPYQNPSGYTEKKVFQRYKPTTSTSNL